MEVAPRYKRVHTVYTLLILLKQLSLVAIESQIFPKIHLKAPLTVYEKESESRPRPWQGWAGLRDPNDPR